MYYDAKADAELVSAPTHAGRDEELPEPHPPLWDLMALAVK